LIVSATRILELNEKYRLISNLDEREYSPEGTGFDIRAGEIYTIKGDGYLGVKDRKTPEIEKVADISRGDKKFTLMPGDFVLVKTMESVSLPSEKIVAEEGAKPSFLTIHVYPRSTLQRCGVHLMATKTDPGYSGELTFGMANMGKSKFELDLGARIANVVFMQVAGDLHRAYGGQWNGGRVAAEKVEKQI
jgi:deoxycytidine triphosphate deaminase